MEIKILTFAIEPIRNETNSFFYSPRICLWLLQMCFCCCFFFSARSCVLTIAAFLGMNSVVNCMDGVRTWSWMRCHLALLVRTGNRRSFLPASLRAFLNELSLLNKLRKFEKEDYITSQRRSHYSKDYQSILAQSYFIWCSESSLISTIPFCGCSFLPCLHFPQQPLTCFGNPKVQFLQVAALLFF